MPQSGQSNCLTLSNLNLHCHLHPLHATNCCRLAVVEDDLKWVINKNKYCYLLLDINKTNFRFYTPMFCTFGHSSATQNDYLMHRKGLKS